MALVEEERLGEDRADAPGRYVVGRDSFLDVTAPPRELASLYFFCVLDPLIEVSRSVAADFFHRPQMYLDLGDDTAPQHLARLHFRTGSDESVPSRDQRAEVFGPLFGDPFGANAIGDGDFLRLSGDLMRSAVAYVERQVETSVAMLREQVRTDHRPFKDYLVARAGASVRWSAQVTLPDITESDAYAILRSPGIAVLFGSPPPTKDWPYQDETNGGKLVVEITKQLGPPDGTGPWTAERCSSMQRVAVRGCEAIASTLDVQDDADSDELDLMISRVYAWRTALRAVTSPPS